MRLFQDDLVNQVDFGIVYQIREALQEDYNNESNELVAAILHNDMRRAVQAAYAIRAKVKSLKAEIEKLKEENAGVKHDKIRRRKEYDILTMFGVYMVTHSYRKTGEVCHCNQKTVKSLLIENGYIDEKGNVLKSW